MRCNCCDKILTDAEIQWNKELGTWEMCSICLDISLDAAYSDGFQDDGDDTLVIEPIDTSDEGVELVPYVDHKPLGD